MKWSIILVILLRVFKFQSTASSVQIKLITNLVKDIIENENVPTVLTVKGCWNAMDKALFSIHVGTSVEYVTNATELATGPKNDFVNKLWYLADLNCTDGLEFLEQVLLSK